MRSFFCFILQLSKQCKLINNIITIVNYNIVPPDGHGQVSDFVSSELGRLGVKEVADYLVKVVIDNELFFLGKP